MSLYTAELELGLLGYSQGRQALSAGSLDELKQAIAQVAERFSNQIHDAQDRDGDLRAMAVPKYPNGYPSVLGYPGDEYYVSILGVTLDGRPLPYSVQARLRPWV